MKAKMKPISTQYILLKKIQVNIMKVQVRIMVKLDSDSTDKEISIKNDWISLKK